MVLHVTKYRGDFIFNDKAIGYLTFQFEGTTILRNVANHSPNATASHSRRLAPSPPTTPLCAPCVSQYHACKRNVRCVQNLSDCWLEATSLRVLPPAIATQIFLCLPANVEVVSKLQAASVAVCLSCSPPDLKSSCCFTDHQIIFKNYSV